MSCVKPVQALAGGGLSAYTAICPPRAYAYAAYIYNVSSNIHKLEERSFQLWYALSQLTICVQT